MDTLFYGVASIAILLAIYLIITMHRLNKFYYFLMDKLDSLFYDNSTHSIDVTRSYRNFDQSRFWDYDFEKMVVLYEL